MLISFLLGIKKNWSAETVFVRRLKASTNISRISVPSNISRISLLPSLPQTSLSKNSSQTSLPKNSPQMSLPKNSSQMSLPKNSFQISLPKNSFQMSLPKNSSQMSLPKNSSQMSLPKNSSQMSLPSNNSSLLQMQVHTHVNSGAVIYTSTNRAMEGDSLYITNTYDNRISIPTFNDPAWEDVQYFPSNDNRNYSVICKNVLKRITKSNTYYIISGSFNGGLGHKYLSVYHSITYAILLGRRFLCTFFYGVLSSATS